MKNSVPRRLSATSEMPGSGWLSTYKAVRELPERGGVVPAVALTAYARPEDKTALR